MQTLEPRLYYLYIPTYTDQNQLPNFDTAFADFNFPHALLREPVRRRRPHQRREPAHGRDRLAPHRPATGVERLRAALGQRYYFARQEVTLPGTPPASTNTSDFLALLSGRVEPALVGRCHVAVQSSHLIHFRVQWNVRYSAGSRAR